MTEEVKFNIIINEKNDLIDVISFLKTHAGEMARAGKPLEVVVKPPKNQRSLEQNKLFHKLCHIASENVQYPEGFYRTTEEWKRILVSAYVKATTGQATVLPGLEGEFVSLCPSTSQMGVKRMADLISYTEAYLAEKELL